MKPINANEIVLQTFQNGFKQIRKYPDFLNVVVTRPDLLPEELQNKIKNDTFLKDYRKMSVEYKGYIRVAIYRIRGFENDLILKPGGMPTSIINSEARRIDRGCDDKYCIFCCVKIIEGDNISPSDWKNSHYACRECSNEHKDKGRKKERANSKKKLIRKLKEEAGEGDISKHMILRKTSTIDFGYRLSKNPKYLVRDPLEYSVLYVCHQLFLREYSYGFIEEWVDKCFKLGSIERRISKVALWKKLNKQEPVEAPRGFKLKDLERTCVGCGDLFFRPVFKTNINLLKKDSDENYLYCTDRCRINNKDRNQKIKYLLEQANKDPEEGRVYVMINEVWKDRVKVGITTQDDDTRIDQYNSYDPYKRYKKVYERTFKHIRLVDALFKHDFRTIDLGYEDRNPGVESQEWYNISKDVVIEHIEMFEEVELNEENVLEYLSKDLSATSTINRIALLITKQKEVEQKIAKLKLETIS